MTSSDPSSLAPPGAVFVVTPRIVMLTICLMLATTMQSLDGTIITVALPHMQGSMSAAQDQISWVLTSYVVIAAICTPLTAFLVARYGRKRLFLFAVIGFTVTSMLCGAAQSLEQIVIFRALQGAAGAFLMPLSQTVLMDIYPREKQGSAMAVWQMGVMVAPILGPTLGGYLTEVHSWRWAFYINMPIGIICTLGVIMLLSESKRDTNIKFDLLGFALIGTAIGSLQMMLDRGTTLDWFSSGEIVIESILAGFAFYLFVAHMFTASQTFLTRAAFKDGNYVLGLTVLFVVCLVMFGTNAIIPTMLQSLMGYPVITTGMLMVPKGVGMLAAMAVAGRLASTVDGRVIIGIGLLVIAAMFLQMSGFTLGVSDQEIMLNGMFQGVGMGFVVVPLLALTFATLNPTYRTEGASMYTLMRNMGISIGISINATMVVRSTQVNHAELVTHITPFSSALRSLVPALGMQSLEGAAVLNGEVDRQAGMIAYLNVFQMSAYLVIGATLLLPLMRAHKRGASTPAPEETVVVEA